MGQNISITKSFSPPRRRMPVVNPSPLEEWKVDTRPFQPLGDPDKWGKDIDDGWKKEVDPDKWGKDIDDGWKKEVDKVSKDWGIDKVDKWVAKVAKDGYDDILDDVDVLEQSWEDIEAVMDQALDDLDDDLQEFWHDIENGFDSFDEWLKDISRLAEDLGLELYQTNVGIVLELPLVNFFGMAIYSIQWVLTEITGENFTCDQATIQKHNICNGCPDGSLDCDQINKKIDGFCSLYGPGGDSLCNSQCKVWSAEWSKHTRKSECNYNPCDNVTQMKGGCCGVCCPLPGEGCECKRTAYYGDPLTCCLTDMKCFIPEDDNLANPDNKQQPECFTDTLDTDPQKKTCNPRHRDASGSDCQDLFIDWCTGKDLKDGDISWYQRWVGDVEYKDVMYNMPCYRMLYRNLYDIKDSCVMDQTYLYSGDPDAYGAAYSLISSGAPVSSHGTTWAQKMFEALMMAYAVNGGSLLGNESSESDTQLNDLAYTICSQNPQVCQDYLRGMCVNFTTDNIHRYPTAGPWCGCYLPPEQYSEYTDLYGIGRECTPVCNMSGTIPLPTQDGTGVRTCSQTYCVIDDVSINLASSQVSGTGDAVTFSQLCGSCSSGEGGACQCTISDTTITAVNSTIGNISVSQGCSGNSTCYSVVENPNGTTSAIAVDCDSAEIVDTDDVYTQAERQQVLRGWIVFFCLVLIIILLWYALRPPASFNLDRTNHHIDQLKSTKFTKSV